MLTPTLPSAPECIASFPAQTQKERIRDGTLEASFVCLLWRQGQLLGFPGPKQEMYRYSV